MTGTVPEKSAEKIEKRREYQRKWRAAHPLTGDALEKHRERTRKWRKNNPEKYREGARKYRVAARDELKQKRRRWYEKNKAAQQRYHRDYLASHPASLAKLRASQQRDRERNRLVDKCAKGWGCSRAVARMRLRRTATVANDAFLQALRAQARTTEFWPTRQQGKVPHLNGVTGAASLPSSP